MQKKLSLAEIIFLSHIKNTIRLHKKKNFIAEEQ